MMKAEYLNPFIQSSKSIINQTTGLTTSLGKIYNKTAPYRGDNVLVLIGLTGDIQGSVTISLTNELTCKIASCMMGGLPVPELEEIAISAISELCNMIMGNTANLFSNINVNIDITPPTVLTGENIKLTPSKSVVVCVPLNFEDNETIEIDITYIEKS